MTEPLMDYPNKEVLGLDPPWVEGTGGTTGDTGEPKDDLDTMTKAQLLTYASDHDVETDDTMTKADIRAAIDKAAA